MRTPEQNNLFQCFSIYCIIKILKETLPTEHDSINKQYNSKYTKYHKQYCYHYQKIFEWSKNHITLMQ